MKPLVSIIIPTFNRAHLIGETLDSVMAQTYQNWECIVVDDGSTDNTAEILAAFIKKDSRIQYHHRPPEHKPGGNGARNYGFKMSKGEFIQWFDDDDMMDTKYVEIRLKEFFINPVLEIVFCAFNYLDKNGKITLNRIGNSSFDHSIFNKIITGSINCSPLSYLIKGEIIEKQIFDEDLYRSQDLDFFFRLFSRNKNLRIKHIPKSLYNVRKHNSNISGVSDKEGLRLQSAFIVHQRILNYVEKEKNEKVYEIHKKNCLKNLKRLLINKNYKLAFIHTWRFSQITFLEKIKIILC